MISSLIKRSSGYFAGLLASKVATTIAFILLARFFSPAIFGDFVLYATLLAVGTYIADVGLVQWYQKASATSHKKDLFQQAVSTRIYTLLLTIFVFGTFLYFIPVFSLEISLLLLVNLIAEAMLTISDGYYLHLKQPRKISLKHGLRALVLIIAMLVYGQNNFSAYQAVFWYMTGSFVAAIWVFPWRTLQNFMLAPTSQAIATIKQSTPYALLTITSFAYARGDQLVIRYSLNSVALGLYGAAYRYLESLSLIPTALAHNLFPLSATKKGISKDHLYKIVAITTALGILVSGTMFALSDFLIVGLLGPAYESAIVLTQIFSLVLLLFFVNAPLATVVQSSKYVQAFLPYGIANTVLNISLNLIFIPVYGLQFAAWAMLFTEITGLVINIAFTAKIYAKK